MKNLMRALFLILLVAQMHSQTNVNADCINFIPLCNTPSFTFFATSGPGNIIDFNTNSNISNPSTNPNPPNSGCLLSGELNPQWLLITVGNPGMLEFVFGAGNSQNPQVGCYDWAMWPYTPTTCADIFNNTLPPIRCNWNSPCSGGTGIASASNIAAVGGSSGNFEAPISVNACQQFIICISNFSGVNTLVSFQSLGTASLSCNPNCNPNYTICAGNSATIVPVNFAALANPVYSMQPGGATSNTGSFVVSPTVTSNYTTFITGTNLQNAIQTITATSGVTVHAQPVAIPNIIQSTCTNSITTLNIGLTFTPAPSAPAYTINWAPIPNGIGSAQQTTVSEFIAAGMYNATVSAASGCSTTVSFSVNPAPALPEINLSPLGATQTLTCYQPTLLISAQDAANSYTWTNGLIAPVFAQQAEMSFTTTGTWTITAEHPVSGCITTKTIVIGQNTITPTSSLGPLNQNITCNLTSVQTVTAAATPTVNISHNILAPQGGTYTANTFSVGYTPGGVGTFTHCATNDANGCSLCKTFTVSSSQGFPTFSVASPQNFTLGCTTKSVAILNIVGGNTSPPGGAVSYTIIGPPTSPVTPSTALSSNSTYTVNVPGTWTVITKDNTNFCETRLPISILQNTFAPNISAIVPLQVLDCSISKTTLRGQSTTNNVNYLWSFPSIPGNQPGDSITVFADFTARTRSTVAQYTLTIEDNSSTCKSTSIVPIFQNLYPPIVSISAGYPALSCKVNGITLTNQSSTGIPPTSGFSTAQVVQAILWEGPSPQIPMQLTTTYSATTVGVYTLTVKDRNNGCISRGEIEIGDNRIFPIVNSPVQPEPSVLDCATGQTTLSPIYSNSTAAFTYSWTAPASASISSSSASTIRANLPGMYRVLTTNPENGCASLALMYVVSGSMTANFDIDKSEGFAPLLVTFSNTSSTFTNNASTGTNIDVMNTIWSFGNGTSSVTATRTISPTALYQEAGTYTVKIFVDKGTCSDTVFKTIKVELPSRLQIPNVFTPDGDNINDVFFLQASNLTSITMVIVDRWGNEVYSVISDQGNVSWDGKNYNGTEVSAGVYFYTLKAQGKDGAIYDRTGSITLIR